jgi:predicted MFS family arabinose efflux permease
MAADNTTSQKKSGRTLFALGLGYLVDQGEAQSMGVLSRIIQSAFNVGYDSIGLMETLRSIAQTVSAPFWGYAADRFSRKKVLMFGTGVWGLWTVALGLMPTFEGLMWVRAISGLGLGCLMPATFSLLGDHFPQSKRGMALGVIGLVGLLGTVLGVLALGFVATAELWRLGFIGLGLASVLSGAAIWWLVEEPPRGSAEPELAGLMTHADEATYKINVKDMLTTLNIPTVWAAIGQGVFGTMPWVVLSIYFINWMVTDLGYDNVISFAGKGSAPVVFAMIVVGAAVGNLIGGLIGDWAEKRSPKYGRTIIGQFSVFIGVPSIYYLITNAGRMGFWSLVGWFFVSAAMLSWAGRGAKEPMLQAVVVPELRSSAYSIVSVVEGGLSAFAGLIAGTLAVKVGLTTALLWTVPFPWLICTVLFSAFYFTYPRDAARARSAIEARRVELQNAHSHYSG